MNGGSSTGGSADKVAPLQSQDAPRKANYGADRRGKSSHAKITPAKRPRMSDTVSIQPV